MPPVNRVKYSISGQDSLSTYDKQVEGKGL